MPDARARPLVVVCEPLEETCVRWLSARCHVAPCEAGADAITPLLLRAEGLIVRTYTNVDAALLDRAPKLRVVGRAGAGVDNIDARACGERGIEVVSTPGANTGAVVELVVALLLDALRPRPGVERPLAAEEWKAARAGAVAERQVSDLVVGIVGLGRVGKGAARALGGLGAKTVYHDLLTIPTDARQGATPVGLGELLEASDVVTLHVDGRRENRGLIGAAELARMKADAILVNTSRGFVLDTPALAAHLRANPAALALLDVHEPEPVPGDHPLLGLPNARLTPHIGAATRRAHLNMSWVVRSVWDALEGSEDA